MKLQNLKSHVQMMTAAKATALPEVNPSSWRGSKQTSAQRGYGYKWQQARAGYLAKHPLCVFCLRNAGIVATDLTSILSECDARHVRLPYASVVDHSVPHRGDMVLFWKSELWQALCKTCHDSEAQRRDNANNTVYNHSARVE